MGTDRKVDVGTVWTQYRTALRSYLARRVSTPDDVDELLQDILLRTHQQLPELDGVTNLRAWLFRIARNITIDYYRKKGRTAQIDPDDLWYHEDTADALNELEECVAPFIASLPAAEAELLHDIDIRGLSQKDYALTKGVSYSTLKSRVQSARKNLRRNFADCCAFELDHSGKIMEYRQKSDRCKDC